ncbi:MAG: hypothetical protein JO371_02430 [Paraburkholderia sp.]|nr:hypothetical protein [Paraburkholderia sp.]
MQAFLFERAVGASAGATVAMMIVMAPRPAFAQTAPAGTPTPASSAAPAQASPAAAAPSGVAGLTPAQQAAVQAYVIKTTQNPVGNISIVPFQNNFNYGVGPYARYQYNLNVQPVIPVMLTPNLNLITRVIMPVINQPSAAPPAVCAGPSGCGSTFGIGDFNAQFFFAPKTKPGALIWGAGPQFLLPTATPSTLGTGKWGVGPTAVALVMPGPWVIGVLANQLWSFAGQTGRPAVSSFLVQPFVNYNLKDGWAISSGPAISANWSASQNKWTVPVGGGVVKTFKVADQIMQLGVSYFSYVARPLSAPQTQLRVNWALVYPVKRISREELIKEALQSK